MSTLNQILEFQLWNNTGKEYLIALGIFIISLVALKIFKSYIIVLLKKATDKSKTKIDDAIVESWGTIKPPFYLFASLYVATRFLTLPELPNKALFYILVTITAYYAVQFIQNIINHITKDQIEKRHKEHEGEDTSMISTLGKLSIGILWAIAILIVLSSFGVNITPLIAGLGVGGIAIAFALQNILEDLFSSFSIYFDAPFKEGDFIIIGKDMGVVKQIGIKTTRLQTLQGQELIISNRELTSTRINNYKRMEKRRIAFTFGVEYSTPNKKMEKIPKIVKDAVNGVKLCELDRAHFKEFGDSSLNYEVVYYIDSSEYIKYIDAQQEINLKIKEVFEKEGIVFAFPTQTIHIEK